MTGITHGQNKVALNSTSSFAVRVECANTHDLIELRLNCNDRRGENERWMMHAGRGVQRDSDKGNSSG